MTAEIEQSLVITFVVGSELRTPVKEVGLTSHFMDIKKPAESTIKA